MKKRIIGIVGGVIGGFVASLPWIILYVYMGFMLSFFAGLIGLGVDYGYRLFKGRVDRKLPLIINISSYSIVVLVQLIIIPIWIVYKETGYFMNASDIIFGYQQLDWPPILFELGIAILFTYLGIKSVLEKVRSEVI